MSNRNKPLPEWDFEVVIRVKGKVTYDPSYGKQTSWGPKQYVDEAMTILEVWAEQAVEDKMKGHANIHSVKVESDSDYKLVEGSEE